MQLHSLKSYSGTLIAFSGLAILAGLFAVVAHMIYRDPALRQDAFLLEIAKGAMALAVGTIIGGFVKILFTAHEIERENRAITVKFRQSVLNDLKSINDRIETSKLLLLADRSAKTYSERMQDCIAARVALRDVDDSVRDGEADQTLRTYLKPRLKDMVDYLDELVDEYVKYFKKVAVEQQFDEARKNAVMQCEAEKYNLQRSSGEQVETPAVASRAWELLCNSTEFQLFGDLIGGDQMRKEQFVYPYRQCRAKIRAYLKG